MDADDWEDAETCRVTIPVDLIRSMAQGMLQSLNQWHKDNQPEGYDPLWCAVALETAAHVAVDMLTSAGEETIQ